MLARDAVSKASKNGTNAGFAFAWKPRVAPAVVCQSSDVLARGRGAARVLAMPCGLAVQGLAARGVPRAGWRAWVGYVQVGRV